MLVGCISGIMSIKSPFFKSKSSAPTSSESSLKAGYLHKQGGSIKTWKKRWFVLYHDHLAYFQSHKDTKEMGTILLNSTVTVKEDTNKNTFLICPEAPSRVYPIQAESSDEMKVWIAAIQAGHLPGNGNSNHSADAKHNSEPAAETDSPAHEADSSAPKTTEAHDTIPESLSTLKSSSGVDKRLTVVEKTLVQKGQEYDVVFDISSISGLQSNHWPVLLSSDKYGLFQTQQPNTASGSTVPSSTVPSSTVSSSATSPVISAMRGVVGLYNKGKTLVINNLSDVLLPSGSKVTTRGLSFVCPPSFAGSMVFLDTAGTHSPVQVHSEDALLDRRATELLLQDLVFDLADYFLVVVQDLTWPDQEFIQSLVLKLNASQKHFKQVIVIHNFRDTEGVQDALDHWKLQVVNSYPMGEQINRPVTLNDKRTVNAIFYASKAVRHVFIAKEGSAAGDEFNAATFQLLKSWLYDIVVEAGKELKPMDKVLQSVNNHLKNYIDEGCKSVKYDVQDTQLVMALEDTSIEEFKLRPFTLGWISPKFETGEFTPAIDTWVGEGWVSVIGE